MVIDCHLQIDDVLRDPFNSTLLFVAWWSDIIIINSLPIIYWHTKSKYIASVKLRVSENGKCICYWYEIKNYKYQRKTSTQLFQLLYRDFEVILMNIFYILKTQFENSNYKC